MRRAVKVLEARALVIGSGPGGSVTALHLAEAGWDVLLAEEGAHHALTETEPYSIEEMDQKWRNGGLTPAFGPNPVTYVEGRCVGGASEINAALYHPPLAEVLDGWRDTSRLADFGAEALAPHVAWVEQEVGVAPFPGGPGLASTRLADGARSLGWKSREVARFWRYSQSPDGTWSGQRQSMSQSLLPRGQSAGLRLVAGLRIRHLEFQGRRAVSALGVDAEGAPVRIRFERVFICAGAVQSALLLRRSGLKRGVGDTLTMNPMVRVAARFGERINEPERGVPVQQIEEFKPLMTLGCSHSSLPHLALWLVGPAADRDRLLADWPRMGVFYAKVSGRARGKVRSVPVTEEAFVRYAPTAEDRANVALAMFRLGQLLFASGAVEIINPVAGQPPIRDRGGLDELRRRMSDGAAQLTTIHLHSTVPMGRETDGCPVDSWGKTYAFENVWVNDASLLPDSPGINPQGTILALARRNVLKALGA